MRPLALLSMLFKCGNGKIIEGIINGIRTIHLMREKFINIFCTGCDRTHRISLPCQFWVDIKSVLSLRKVPVPCIHYSDHVLPALLYELLSKYPKNASCKNEIELE